MDHVDINTRLCGRHQFIRQFVASKPKKDVELEFAGRVLACDGAVAASIRTGTRIVVPGSGCTQAANVSFAVRDEPALTEALAGIAQAFPFSDVKQFSLKFAALDMSFEDLVNVANGALSSGCCSDCGNSVTRAATIEVGFSDKKSGGLHWTCPVRAAIRIAPDDPEKYGPIDEEAKATLATEDCDSEWWIRGFWSSRETTCHGDCSNGKLCYCTTDKNGNRLQWCKGWNFCWC